MGFRFWRRVKVAPGVTLNLSKSGVSVSFGPRGAKLTVGPGGKRATVGVPGTGLFYTTKLDAKGLGKGRAGKRQSPAIVPPAEDKLDMGFFKRLVTPDNEEALVDGFREIVKGNDQAAYERLERATDLADGAFLSGVLALRLGDPTKAVERLKSAVVNEKELGACFKKYEISALISLPITEEITAHVGPDLRGALLALVEGYQEIDWPEEGIKCLARLNKLCPEDLVVLLSLAELLYESGKYDKSNYKKVVNLAAGLENDSALHAATMLYHARSLSALGLPKAARDVLTKAMRKKKDRPRELLSALRYERGLIYENLGQRKRAREEFARIYAEDPGYEDVAQRLGI